MTDRIRTLTVFLDHDMRTDDVEIVKQAIRMVRCVADVQNGDIVDAEEQWSRIAAMRNFMTTHEKFLALFRDFGGDQEKLKRVKEILGTS